MFHYVETKCWMTLKGIDEMITAGIDCGAKNTKTVILRDGRIMGKALVQTANNMEKTVKASIEEALRTAGLAEKELERITLTGMGKKAISIADEEIDAVKAMATAANHYFPNSRTVVDVGAEEGRVAKIDEKGDVVDFAVNERCAAGAGAFIETMARMLEVGIEEMGLLALKSEKAISMNAQCVIFAESEVVGLIHRKAEKADISKAIHDATAGRVASMIRRVGVNEDVVMLGGMGYDPGFVEAVKRELRLDRLFIPDDPEFGGAVGAAVVASKDS